MVTLPKKKMRQRKIAERSTREKDDKVNGRWCSEDGIRTKRKQTRNTRVVRRHQAVVQRTAKDADKEEHTTEPLHDSRQQTPRTSANREREKLDS